MKSKEYDFERAVDFFLNNYEKYGVVSEEKSTQTGSPFEIPLSKAFLQSLEIEKKKILEKNYSDFSVFLNTEFSLTKESGSNSYQPLINSAALFAA